MTSLDDDIADYESRVSEYHRRFARLSEQQVYAAFLLLFGIVIIVGNITGATGPRNNTLGAIGLAALICAGIWFWSIRDALASNLNSMRVTEAALKSARDRQSKRRLQSIYQAIANNSGESG